MTSTATTSVGPINVVHWLLGDTDNDSRIALAPATTYRQLRADVDEFARSLLERTRPPAAVLVSAAPAREDIVGLLGVLAAGLTAVPVAPDIDERTLRHVLADVRPVARIGAIAALPSERDPATGTARSNSADSAALVIYTSGTTAAPKGVQLSHHNLVANATAVSSFVALRPGDVVSLVLPLHFSYGLSMLLIALRARARLVLHPEFKVPADCVRAMQAEHTTVFAGVPYHYQALLRDHSGLRDAQLRLRLLLSAGGAMTSEILAGLRAQLPAAQPLIMYGQTEATARLSYLPPDQLERRPQSIGRGMPGIKLTVRDTSGRPVAPGELGEVYAAGDSVMLGYLGDPAATAEVLTAWGLRTHDVATIDDDGYIYLQGRTADYAKTRGVRVSLVEIESIVEELPEVAEALASVEITPDHGEQVVLAVRLDDRFATRDWPPLRNRIKAQLPPPKRPSRIERVHEIARTATGKKSRRRIGAPLPPVTDQ